MKLCLQLGLAILEWEVVGTWETSSPLLLRPTKDVYRDQRQSVPLRIWDLSNAQVVLSSSNAVFSVVGWWVVGGSRGVGEKGLYSLSHLRLRCESTEPADERLGRGLGRIGG